MIRKTFKSTMPEFKLNEEMADKEKKILSSLHYQNIKVKKTETDKLRKNPSTKP